MPCLAAVLLFACGLIFSVRTGAIAADYVIQVSVDGVGSSYLQALVAGKQLPNFQRLQQEGAWTDNARCDYDYSVTLPNHITMVTGRGVMGTAGHGWEDNTTAYYPPDSTTTIHSNKGSYVSSVFDVAAVVGSTALVSGKVKFSLIDTSYDTNSSSSGTDRITYSSIPTTTDDNPSDPSSPKRIPPYLEAMAATPFKYSLVHLIDPDKAGSWGSTKYNDAVKRADGYLGQILNLIDNNPTFTGKTALIVTADHGGQNNSHSTESCYLNYRIPFYVWGPGVTRNTDLYSLNHAIRLDPGAGRPDYAAPKQPVRNGDGANLALKLLGLGPIPDSTINATQDLNVFGEGTAPRQAIAYTAFNETPIGVTAWTPAVTNTELGFATSITAGPVGDTYSLGTYDSTSSPRRFRMRGYTAETTFDAVDLRRWQNMSASIDILIADTGYEADNYFRARLTNGTDWITLAEVQGTAMDSLNKGEFLHYSVQVPGNWFQAKLVISSSTDSSSGAEIVNFDNIFFEGRPSLAWTGVHSIWDVNGTASFSGNATGKFNDEDSVTFDDRNGNTAITIADGGVAPSRVVFFNTSDNAYTLSGGPIKGTASLMISGGGQVTMGIANTYTGGTFVMSGTLIVTNADAIPPGQDLTIGNGGMIILSSDLSVANGSAAAVPEPTMLVLLAAGALGMAAWLRRGRKAGQQSVRHTPCAAVAQQ